MCVLKSRLEGSYANLRLLGEGSTSAVFYGQRKKDQKPCVIKVFQQGFDEAQSEQPLARFERECKALSALSHRAIVKIVEWGSSGSFPYIVMTYEKAQPLADFLKKGSAPLPLKKILTLISTLAQALAHAHDRQIIHRDIKPENILLKEDGTPLLIDFGLVSSGLMQTYRTATGVILGSPPYMAPELFGTERASVQTDLYSLALIFYELVMKKRAFTGPLTDVIRRKLKEPPPALPSSCGLPSHLITRVNALLARKLELSAADFAKELLTAQHRLPQQALAAPTSSVTKSCKWPYALLLLLCLLALWPRSTAPVPLVLEGSLSPLLESPQLPPFDKLQKYLSAIEKLCQQAFSAKPERRRAISQTLAKLKAQVPQNSTLSAIISATTDFQGPNKHRALVHYKKAFSYFKAAFGQAKSDQQSKQLPLAKLLISQILALESEFDFLDEANRFYFRLPKAALYSKEGIAMGETLSRLSSTLLAKQNFFYQPLPSMGRSFKERVNNYHNYYQETYLLRMKFNDDSVVRLATHRIEETPRPTEDGNELLRRMVNIHWLFYAMLPHPQCPPPIRQEFVCNSMDICGYFGKLVHFSGFMDIKLWGEHINQLSCANRALDQVIILAACTGGKKSNVNELVNDLYMLHSSVRFLNDMRAVRIVLSDQFKELVFPRLHGENAVYHHVDSLYRLYTLRKKYDMSPSKVAVQLAKQRIDEYEPKGKVIPHTMWMIFDVSLRHRLELIKKSKRAREHVAEIEESIAWFKDFEIERGKQHKANLWAFALTLVAKGKLATGPLSKELVNRLVAARNRCYSKSVKADIDRLLTTR